MQDFRANAHADNFVDVCFTALLEYWLTQNPTWSDLIRALKSLVISREDIARKIETLLVRQIATPCCEILLERKFLCLCTNMILHIAECCYRLVHPYQLILIYKVSD